MQDILFLLIEARLTNVGVLFTMWNIIVQKSDKKTKWNRKTA